MTTALTPEQQVWLTQGVNLHQNRDYAAAIAFYQRILAEQPDQADVLRLLGTAECQSGYPEDGARHLDASLKLSPDQPDAWFNRGSALEMLGQRDEALNDYTQAVMRKPDYVMAWARRGDLLMMMQRPDAAVASYNKALALRDDLIDVYCGLGNALQDLGRVAEAVAAYDKALAIDASPPGIHANRANALLRLNRLEEAVISYEQALALKPDFALLPGQVLHTLAHLCDWTGFPDRIADLAAQIRQNKIVAEPFTLHFLLDAPDLQRQATAVYAAVKYPEHHALPSQLPPLTPHNNERIRIAYISSDFKDHPVAHLMRGVLEHHDRERFEIFAISTTRSAEDRGRAGIRNAADQFIDMSTDGDLDIARRLRDRQIDIAVDLNGFTLDGRMGIFAARAAPVQVSYIGFLGTLAVPYMDYLIADKTMVPEASQGFYSENIAWLPSYQANAPFVAEPPPAVTRKAHGLPDDAFVFCAFNGNYKISPDVFASWMRILAKVPHSVLWLYVTNPEASRNLKAKAEDYGITSDRLIFAERVPMESHLARQTLADLFLDTHPYNAGATASAALRAGLPVLTRMGQSFASRMGGSLLNAVGLPELITETPEAYEALAVELATQPERIAALRQTLCDNLSTCALFDTAAFTRNLEAAYTVMVERARNDLPPEAFAV